MPIDISITGRQRPRKPVTIRADLIETTLRALTEAVLADPPKRCPMNSDPPSYGPISSLALRQMAVSGLLRVDIFVHNFRRVTFLKGPLKGKATAEPPPLKGGGVSRPYKTIP